MTVLLPLRVSDMTQPQGNIRTHQEFQAQKKQPRRLLLKKRRRLECPSSGVRSGKAISYLALIDDMPGRQPTLGSGFLVLLGPHPLKDAVLKPIEVIEPQTR